MCAAFQEGATVRSPAGIPETFESVLIVVFVVCVRSDPASERDGHNCLFACLEKKFVLRDGQ